MVSLQSWENFDFISMVGKSIDNKIVVGLFLQFLVFILVEVSWKIGFAR